MRNIGRNVNKPTRETIFQDAAKKMRVGFEDARNNVPHRGQAGAEGEDILITFLNDHLPSRFKATSGFIIDRQDTVSSHIDVIIYDAFNCPIYRTSERGMIIPNDNVACVFEVKYSLTTTLLSQALKKIHEVKNLLKTPLIEVTMPMEQVETYGAIFAFECNLSYETVLKKWSEELTDMNPIFKSCSIITVLDRGNFTTVMDVPGYGAAPASVVSHN